MQTMHANITIAVRYASDTRSKVEDSMLLAYIVRKSANGIKATQIIKPYPASLNKSDFFVWLLKKSSGIISSVLFAAKIFSVYMFPCYAHLYVGLSEVVFYIAAISVSN